MNAAWSIIGYSQVERGLGRMLTPVDRDAYEHLKAYQLCTDAR